MVMNTVEIIKLLKLKLHPGEGGYYRETYRSDEKIPVSALPPRYKTDKQFSTAIEFRHGSWFVGEVYRILEHANTTLCLADMPRLQCPRQVTGDFTYVRFHGKPHLYQSLYSEEALAEWCGWLGDQLYAGRDAFVYFNNDFNAHAVQNARQLRHMLARRGLSV